MSMTVKDGIKCDGCKTFLPQAGIALSGWCRHNGKDYCLSCQKKKKIGLYDTNATAKRGSIVDLMNGKGDAPGGVV